jgi:hypothetical protein
MAAPGPSAQTQGEMTMKKIMSLMLGLTLLTGAVTFATAQDDKKEDGKKKKKKKKADETK